MIGMFHESGPCEVILMADGTYGTQSRLWGWDRSSNMLFVDQPTKVGFSYDRLVNYSVDFFDTGDHGYGPPEPLAQNQPPWSFLNGTLSSQDSGTTANTTDIAAHAMWHFLQGFLSAFPQYNPGTRPNSTVTHPAAVNLFAESYGGQYGPTFAEFFEEQNRKRITGEISSNATLEVKLASVGIVNGIIDELIQAPYYPMFAANNTYGIKAITDLDMYNALSTLNGPGGCKEGITNCRSLMDSQDPDGEGDVANVNQACATAFSACNDLLNVYETSGRSYYDVRQLLPDTIPNGAYLEYLNEASVQKSIGVPVNFTDSSRLVQSEFISSKIFCIPGDYFDWFTDRIIAGDEMNGRRITALSKLLSMGVRVALIYGDADYICNWMGGEAVSLALAALIPSYASAFPAAGYAPIAVNTSYIGGDVRQFGNLSFSRVFDSGHLVPAYQPETAFTIFTRIIQGTELSTGEAADLSTYASTGPANSTHKNSVPSKLPEHVCYVRSIPDTCSSEDFQNMLNGIGAVFNGVWYENKDDYKPMSSTIAAGVPGTLPTNPSTSSINGGASTSTVQPTGVYVATGVPTTKNAAAGLSAATALPLALAFAYAAMR
jgi:carboxypeptidase C (cathepsin A)